MLPTFKLFHHVFQLVHSNNVPMFEFRFRGKACGYPSSASKPLVMLPTLKGWNGEFVFLRGVDIRFMPTFKEEPLAMNFEVFDLQDAAMDRVHAFCQGLGRQVTRDDLMSHQYLFELGCLPGYSPEFEKVVQMSKSSKSLGAALRSIGHVRDNTKAPGDASGSQAHQEGASENTAPHPEPVDLEIGVEDASLIARKRPRVTSTRTELFGTMLSDCEVVKEGSGAGGPENFRPHEPAPVSPEERNFIGFLADLPSKSEWEEMSQSTSTELLRQMMGVFGQLGVRVAGAAAKACGELKEAQVALSSAAEKDKEIAELKQQLDELKVRTDARIEKFKGGVKQAAEERDAAKAKVADYKAEVKRLRDELKAKKTEEQVIADFRGSEAYDDDLAAVASKKIHRCWVISEKMIKTAPETATWENFIEEYLAAEDALARGEGEPKAFGAPDSSPPPEA